MGHGEGPRPVSTIGLVGLAVAITVGAIGLVFLALHRLSLAEESLDRDQQPMRVPVPEPMQVPICVPMQVPKIVPMQVRLKVRLRAKEEVWSAPRRGFASSPASSWSGGSSPDCSLVAPLLGSPSPGGDSDGLRLRRRSHTRALRRLRCWLRVQGYRPTVQKQRPMITVSCRHARAPRAGAPRRTD